MSIKPEKTWGPFYDGRGMELTIKVHYRGKWHIESEMLGKPIFGKATMVIQIRNPHTNQVVDYSPEHSEICDGILEAMLQAELDNDTYKYTEGPNKDTSRPTQIFLKLNQVKMKLTEWKKNAVEAGLKPPTEHISDFI